MVKKLLSKQLLEIEKIYWNILQKIKVAEKL